MPKKVIKMVKLQVPAGKATPAPPVGPALGQAGINIMAFVKDFNARTEKQAGLIILLKLRYSKTVPLPSSRRLLPLLSF